MTGLYIHVPFCIRKCPYCGFYSVKHEKTLADGYVEAVIRNIRSYKGKRIETDTVYFGGGTPSLLPPEDIKKILEAIKDSFILSDGSEITLEANPSSVTLDSLRGYRKAGVNRISFGVQSCDDGELKLLGRLHSVDTAQKAVMSAKSAGIENISVDLMIGTPNQTLGSLLRSADTAVSMDVNHISCYMLKIETGTPYDCEAIRQKLVSDDDVSDMYLALCKKLKEHGFKRYEISNFSKEGYESRHNCKYWRLEDYIGIGPSAHSYFNGERFYVPGDIEKFCRDELQTVIIEDSEPDILEEYIMLSLRLDEGMSLEKLSLLGGDAGAVKKRAEFYEPYGLVKQCGGRISLTDEGCLVSNGLILEMYLAAVGENQ